MGISRFANRDQRRRECVVTTTHLKTANFKAPTYGTLKSGKRLSFEYGKFLGIVGILDFGGLFGGSMKLCFCVWRFDCPYLPTVANFGKHTAYCRNLYKTTTQTHLTTATPKNPHPKSKVFAPLFSKAGEVKGEQPLSQTSGSEISFNGSDKNPAATQYNEKRKLFVFKMQTLTVG